MKDRLIEQPVPPADRHICEGELPRRPKYRLIKEICGLTGVPKYRVEKRHWLLGWRTVWPTGMNGVFGGVQSEATARSHFDSLTGRKKDSITVIDQA